MSRAVDAGDRRRSHVFLTERAIDLMIAIGLRGVAGTGAEPTSYADLPPPAPVCTPTPAAAPTPYDPYAGASVPTTR